MHLSFLSIKEEIITEITYQNSLNLVVTISAQIKAYFFDFLNQKLCELEWTIDSYVNAIFEHIRAHSQ